MSKGSNVTGTGCLIKFKFFFVLASWQMRENDFGSSSGVLAVVDDDWGLNWLTQLGGE